MSERQSADERLAEIAGLSLAEAERLTGDLPERHRMAAIAWAYTVMRRNWQEGGTYRALLGALGFEKTMDVDAYRLLMAAGALDLNNALAELDRLRATARDAESS